MSTDLTAELSSNSLTGVKPTPTQDSGPAAIDNGAGRVDPHQDRRYTTKDGIESKCATTGRISGYQPTVYDIFKKICRAERFGIPVHLSEAEKRYSRAERFGIGSAPCPDEIAEAEELKRKARAKRFELSSLSVVTDEEAKKKARLARFSPFP